MNISPSMMCVACTTFCKHVLRAHACDQHFAFPQKDRRKQRQHFNRNVKRKVQHVPSYVFVLVHLMLSDGKVGQVVLWFVCMLASNIFLHLWLCWRRSLCLALWNEAGHHRHPFIGKSHFAARTLEPARHIYQTTMTLVGSSCNTG